MAKKGNNNSIIAILLVAVVAIGGFAVMNMGDDTNAVPESGTDNESGDSSSSTPTDSSEERQGDLVLSFLDGTENPIDDTSNVKVILTQKDAYASATEAIDTYIDDDGLVDEDGQEDYFGDVANVDANGEVTFSNVNAKESGSYYDILIYDPDTTYTSTDFVSEYGTIMVKGKYNQLTDEESVDVITGSDSDFESDMIKLNVRGDMTFTDGASTSAIDGYVYEVDENGELEDQTTTLNLMSGTDRSEINDMRIFVEILDDSVGEMEMNLDDVTVDGDNSVSFTKMDDVDDDTLSAIEPSASTPGTSTMYVLDDEMYDLTRTTDTKYEDMKIKIKCDADASGNATASEGSIVVHVVSFAASENTNVETEEYIIGFVEGTPADTSYVTSATLGSL